MLSKKELDRIRARQVDLGVKSLDTEEEEHDSFITKRKSKKKKTRKTKNSSSSSSSNNVERSDSASRVRFKKVHRPGGAGPTKDRKAGILKKTPRSGRLSPTRRHIVPASDVKLESKILEEWKRQARSLMKSVSTAPLHIHTPSGEQPKGWDTTKRAGDQPGCVGNLMPAGTGPLSENVSEAVFLGCIDLGRNRFTTFSKASPAVAKIFECFGVDFRGSMRLAKLLKTVYEKVFGVEFLPPKQTTEQVMILGPSDYAYMGANKLTFACCWGMVLGQFQKAQATLLSFAGGKGADSSDAKGSDGSTYGASTYGASSASGPPPMVSKLLWALATFWLSTNPDYFEEGPITNTSYSPSAAAAAASAAAAHSLSGNYFIEAENPAITNSYFVIEPSSSSSLTKGSSLAWKVVIKPLYTHKNIETEDYKHMPVYLDPNFEFSNYKLQGGSSPDYWRATFSFSLPSSSDNTNNENNNINEKEKEKEEEEEQEDEEEDSEQEEKEEEEKEKGKKKKKGKTGEKRKKFITIDFPCRTGLFAERLGQAVLLQARKCQGVHAECRPHSLALGMCPNEQKKMFERYNSCLEANPCPFDVKISKHPLKKSK